jgi:hypothetical protein
VCCRLVSSCVDRQTKMKDRAMAARERPLDFSDRKAGLQARALQAAGERKVGAASSPKKVGVLGVTENSRVLILSQGSNLWSSCGMPGLRAPRGSSQRCSSPFTNHPCCPLALCHLGDGGALGTLFGYEYKERWEDSKKLEMWHLPQGTGQRQRWHQCSSGFLKPGGR